MEPQEKLSRVNFECLKKASVSELAHSFLPHELLAFKNKFKQAHELSKKQIRIPGLDSWPLMKFVKLESQIIEDFGYQLTFTTKALPQPLCQSLPKTGLYYHYNHTIHVKIGPYIQHLTDFLKRPSYPVEFRCGYYSQSKSVSLKGFNTFLFSDNPQDAFVGLIRNII
jgi:hypothetical protein